MPNPIDEGLEQCDRWLHALDVERDEVMQLMTDLRALRDKVPMLFEQRPRRNVTAVLPAIKKALRVKAS